MQVPLDTITQQRLDALAVRRRILIRRRGLSAMLLALVAAVLAGAAVDRLFILEDQARWILSGCVYAVVAAVALMFWVRPALRLPSVHVLARFVESCRAELHEDLLSAVELGAASSPADRDSTEFRAILQTTVADRMRTVSAHDLLPPRLVRSWVVLATLAIAVFAGLFFVRDLHLGRLVARTLLPMANIERVSATTLSIVEPGDPNIVVPQGDTVTIRVACSGPTPDKATLEIVRAGHDRQMIPMQPAIQAQQFQATVTAEEGTTTYRIRARDALTRRYAITSRLRPYVTAFDTTYEYPAYMSRAPGRAEGLRRGDLTAYAGTTAQLVLHTDQPVNQASIDMEQGGKFTRLPVQIVEPQKLTVTIPINGTGEYQIALRAAATGFDNGKLSPRYEIKSLPDERPTVRLIEPAKDLLVPPNDIVHVAGTANDDVGLARVCQRAMINDGAWQDLPLPASATLPSAGNAPVGLQKEWDLAGLGLKAGDRLTTKLVAVDLKGSQAESAPVRIMIASSSFSPADQRPIAARRAIDELLRQFEKVTADAQAAAQEAAGQVNPDDAASRAENATRARSAADRVSQEAAALQKAIIEAARNSSGGADSWELATLGTAIARMQRQDAESAARQIDATAANRDAGSVRETFNRAAEKLKRAQQDAHEVREMFSDVLLSDEAGLVAQDLLALEREEARLETGAGRDAASAARWQRRQRTALDQLQQVEARFTDLAKRTSGRPAEVGRHVTERLQGLREELTKNLTATDPAQVKDQQARIQAQLHDARAEWMGLVADQAAQADARRHQLESKLPQMEPLLNTVADRSREAAQQSRNVAERQARGDKPEDMAGDQARLDQLEASKANAWKTAIDLLADRAKLEEARPDHDPAFVSDLDLMHRALKAMRTRPFEDEATTKTLAAAGNAFKVLEAGHGVTDLAANLEAMTTHERWESASPNSYTQQPENSDWANHMFGGLPDRLAQSGNPSDAAGRIARARDSAQWRESFDQMQHRRRDAEPLTQVTAKLDHVAREVGAVRDGIQWRLNQARKTIAAQAPSLSETMADLAEKADQVQHAALDTAAGLENKTPEEAARDTTALRQDHAQIDEGVQDVQDALRREANLQDLATPAGREQARDADDAVAMLEPPRQQADEAFDKTAKPAEQRQQVQNLAGAAESETQLANTLRRLAEHQKLLETGGDVTESRAALRQAERDQGLQPTLDQQFAATERMAALTELNPQEELAALEQELARSAQMRETLKSVAQESLDEARSNLRQASGKEQKVSERLAPATADESKRRDALGERLRELGQRSQELAAKDLSTVREQADKGQVAAKDRLEEAQKSIAKAGENAADPPAQLDDLAKQAKEAATQLTQGAEGLKGVAESSRRAAREAQKAGQPGQERANSANQAADGANSAADRARQLAQEANQIAREAAQRTPAPNELHSSQEPVAGDVNAAAGAIQRAARMAERTGDSSTSEALAELGNQINDIAKDELPAATTALRSKSAGQAAQAVEQARSAIDSHLADLDAAAGAQANAAHAGEPASEAAPAADAAEAMARALAQLDQAAAPDAAGRPSKDRARSAAAEAAALTKAAMAASARAMRQARASGQMTQAARTPRTEGFVGTSRAGAAVEGTADNSAHVLPPAARPAGNENWGKLPPKLAQDLMAGRREKIADDYRDRVESYFQAIAEKAKDNPK